MLEAVWGVKYSNGFGDGGTVEAPSLVSPLWGNRADARYDVDGGFRTSLAVMLRF